MTQSENDNFPDWNDYSQQWTFRPGVTYLNHGSFGPSPQPVRQAQRHFQDLLESQPMDFYVREMEGLLGHARGRLAQWVGCGADDLVFVENSTYGMNVVEASLSLQAGDEVLLTDHEYGAVARVWQRACDKAGAKVVWAELPLPFTSTQDVTNAITSAISERTRLLVVSHVTSPAAVILPIAEICRAAREQGVTVCVDGPHAVAMVDLNIAALDCDFYTASCHKWLCAPFGSGFLYVHPRVQAEVKPPIKSWGRLRPAMPERWDEEFTWIGTRDPSAYLAVPAAIDFLELELELELESKSKSKSKSVGVEAFRDHTHRLAKYAREQIEQFTGRGAFVPDSPQWYGSMIALPLLNGRQSDTPLSNDEAASLQLGPA